MDWIWGSGESVLPILADSELVLMEKASKYMGGLEYGDVVIVIYLTGLQCVKRIAGMESLVVAIKNSTVILNGNSIDEPYLNEGYSKIYKQ